MLITNKLLKHMPSGDKACKPARKWFKRTFPDGADWEEAWSACQEDDWLIWFALNYLPRDTVVELAFKFIEQAKGIARQDRSKDYDGWVRIATERANAVASLDVNSIVVARGAYNVSNTAIHAVWLYDDKHKEREKHVKLCHAAMLEHLNETKNITTLSGNTCSQHALAREHVGPVPEGARQYCVNMRQDGSVGTIWGFEAAYDEPTQVIVESDGSLTMVFPDTSLDLAREHARQVMAAYMED